MVIFFKIIKTFFDRNVPNNKFLDVANRETNNVMWRRCWSPSIVNLEQLIFTWKGLAQLVFALFPSNLVDNGGNKLFRNFNFLKKCYVNI